MENTLAPGFSSDVILEAYVRLNQIDWSREENNEPEEEINEPENEEQ